MKDLEKIAEEEKQRIEPIRERIRKLTEEIQQKKDGTSTQILNIKPQPELTSGMVSPSMFSEIQNMLLDTITKGYETIIQEKEKIIQKLQKEIDDMMEKYQQLKYVQEQQIARVTSLSTQQDKSLLDLVKKIAELESENRELRNKIHQMTIQTEETARIIQQDRIQYVLSHLSLISEIMKECLRYFRTPLGVIQEAFELVKEDVNGHPVNKKLYVVQQEMFKVRNIISSAAERLKLPPSVNLQKVLLKSIVSTAVSKFQSEFVNKNIEFVQEFASEEIYVVAEFQLLVDCISEIVENAIEAFYPPCSGSKIIVRVKKIDNIPTLTVEDNGCGIPEHLQSKLFNLFFTTKFEQGHYGIGLFKVKWILTMFDAKIRIYSLVHKGTTVTIEFSSEGK
jgi:signal transduction histidine kinase